MDKTIYTTEYQTVLELLKELRHEAGISQVELADQLQQSQSFVSKYERGDRRLDIVQVRTICQQLGTTLSVFVENLENRLASTTRRRKK
ncbi:MAG: helix-turn-helix transcriptional regulator [Planctomycetaceae bacterium]